MGVNGFGVIMLVHGNLRRAAQVAQYWIDNAVPLVIHADLATPLDQLRRLSDVIADAPLAGLIQTQRGQWGSWGLVAATQDALHALFNIAPDIGHVALTSGTCLPIKPASQFRAYLSAHPAVDFIDSHPVGPSPNWVQDGLELERFTLRFPRFILGRPHLFNAAVTLQRRLRLQRSMPDGLTPYIGKQWWCLCVPTLRAILDDPGRAKLDRFFAQTWIPDESYFQTLARKYARQIEPSLTVSEFDPRGRPFVFYDEHLTNLQSDTAFFARKIWAGADNLYRAFLSDAAPFQKADPMHDLLCKAQISARQPRRGLVSQNRFVSPRRNGLELAHPIIAFSGFHDRQAVLQSACKGLSIPLHGRIFAPDRLEYAPALSAKGRMICPSPRIRDKNQRSFLQNLIYFAGSGPQAFLLGAGDGPNPMRMVSQCDQALVFLIRRGQGDRHLSPLFAKTAKATVVELSPQTLNDNPDYLVSQIQEIIKAHLSRA